MDIKQFALFEQGVQWVADEQQRRLREEAPNGVTHRQQWWAAGKVTDKTVREGVAEYAVVCPTSCCLAGNFCSIAGDEFLVYRSDAVRAGSTGIIETRMVRTPEGSMYPVSQRAQELVGIDEAHARWLFDGTNTPEIVIGRAKTIAAAHGHNLQIM